MGDSQRELNLTLEFLETLANERPEVLKKKVYDAISGISFLIIEAKDAKFKRGWASNLKDRNDTALFTVNESRILEDGARKFIKPLFEHGNQTQAGGLNPSGSPSILEPVAFDPESVSLDKTFEGVKATFKTIDEKVKDFSRTFGPFRFFYDRDSEKADKDTDFHVPIPIPIPAPPFFNIIRIPVNPRAVPVAISIIIEAVRLIYSVGPLSNDTTRKILSLLLALVDILKGDWKQGILSLLGFFGEAPLVAGLLGKVIINLMELMSPSLQDALITNVYQSVKSMFLGFFLWGFANFAPYSVRLSARGEFDKMKEMANSVNNEIGKVESSMQSSLNSLGLTVKFNKIPADFVPTFDDIQSLQSIITQESIVCSKEFQDSIQKLKENLLMRLILELMNIPMDAGILATKCGEKAGKPLAETMGDILTPSITSNGQGLPMPVVPGLPVMPVVPGLPMPAMPAMPGLPVVPGLQAATDAAAKTASDATEAASRAASDATEAASRATTQATDAAAKAVAPLTEEATKAAEAIRKVTNSPLARVLTKTGGTRRKKRKGAQGTKSTRR